MNQTAYNPDEVVYRPRGGLTGRLQKHVARRLGVTPLKIKLDRPIVTFSFDDFPKTAMELGAARLKARGWRGSFFVSGGLAGVTNHHGDLYTGIANGFYLGSNTSYVARVNTIIHVPHQRFATEFQQDSLKCRTLRASGAAGCTARLLRGEFGV